MNLPGTLSRIVAGAVGSVYGWRPATPLPNGTAVERPARELYALLWNYYQSNGLYDDVARALAIQGIGTAALKPLRNPANRVVELHVAKIWPGTLPDALPLVADNPHLAPALEQVWSWSNWASQKQVFVRKVACLGDVFVRVATTATSTPDGTPLPPAQTRVYFQLLSPEYVPDFDTNERGDLTYIRIDVPQARREGDRVVALTHTEVWQKGRLPGEDGRVRTWLHSHGDEPDLERLGAPATDRPLSAYGIDFLPFRQCQFRDVGEPRGVGAFTHALDKIDAANLAATRLYQNLFRSNEEAWVLEGEGRVDSSGREIPPPQITGLNGTTTGAAGVASTADDGTLDVGGARLFRLPGGWTLRSVVPQLDYTAELAALTAHMEELEDDLPEMAYYRLREGGDAISGRALQKKLSALVDRVLEARGNCEEALIRLDQMALSIGQAHGLPLFARERIGTYANGDFAHSFAAREVITPDALEDAQATLARAQAITEQMKWLTSAPPLVLEQAGFTAPEVAELLAFRDQQQAQRQQLPAQPAQPAPFTLPPQTTAAMAAAMQAVTAG